MGNFPPPTHTNIFREACIYWTSIRPDKNMYLDFRTSFFSFAIPATFPPSEGFFSPNSNTPQQITTMGHLTSTGKPTSEGRSNLQHSKPTLNKPPELFTFYLNTHQRGFFYFLKAARERRIINEEGAKPIEEGD